MKKLFLLLLSILAVAILATIVHAAGVEVASRPSAVTARPTCAVNQRGTLWVDYGLTAGTADRLEICSQTTGAALGWRVVQLVAGTSLSSVIVSNSVSIGALP